MMPALSRNVDQHQGRLSSRVARMIVDFSKLSYTREPRPDSSYSMTALNVLCLQCSLQVWRDVVSRDSTSVGSRCWLVG